MKEFLAHNFNNVPCSTFFRILGSLSQNVTDFGWLFNLVPHDYKAGQKGFAKNPRKVFHRSCLYPIVPIGSSQFSKFIDYMRSISLHRLYKQQEKKLYEQHNIILQESCKDVDIPSRVWICVNCWEVLLG